MTVDEVKRAVDEIREMVSQGDSVMSHHAHERQDEIYESVLTAIADRKCNDPAGCATAALAIKEIEFSRWYS